MSSIAAYSEKVADLSEKMKDGEVRFGIVLADVDRLKSENDSNGHDSGDRYIVNCASILSSVFRNCPVYRTGGDEFTVVLEGVFYEKADRLLSQLRFEVENASRLPDTRSGRASFSFGYAEFDPNKDTSVSDVVKRADIEMYREKAKRNVTRWVQNAKDRKRDAP
jgi:diguanylate cyclase (GGDEF)-like protein